MCLKENYSDSPSNEYSRHYSAESESVYLRRQNMNSKLGEEQKVKVLISTQIRIQSKKKVKMIRFNTRTWPSPSNALLLGRVLELDSAHPYSRPTLFRFLGIFIAVIL